MLKSMVREALVGSVAWLAPPVSFERTQVSVVPKARPPALGPLPEAAAVEDPFRLGRREIGVDRQPRLFPDEPGDPRLGGELPAAIGRAAALPDDGVGHGPAGLPVPDDRRLALVGDADGGDRPAGDRREDLLDGPVDAPPDLLGIVLDPAGPGEILGEFLVGGGDRPAALVEDDGPAAGRALVDGQDVAHVRPAGRPSRRCPRRPSPGRGRSRGRGTSPGIR